jgi:hypothetical protein
MLSSIMWRRSIRSIRGPASSRIWPLSDWILDAETCGSRPPYGRPCPSQCHRSHRQTVRTSRLSAQKYEIDDSHINCQNQVAIVIINGQLPNYAHGKGGPAGHPCSRSKTVVPCQILARLEPDRAILLKIQALAAPGYCSFARRTHQGHEGHPGKGHPSRMRKFLRKFRL